MKIVKDYIELNEAIVDEVFDIIHVSGIVDIISNVNGF
jgi:hypothetical protein